MDSFQLSLAWWGSSLSANGQTEYGVEEALISEARPWEVEVMGPLPCLSHHSPCHYIRGCEEVQTTLRTPWKRVLHLGLLRPSPSLMGGAALQTPCSKQVPPLDF